MDWSAIESECHKRWATSRVFEAGPDNSSPKKFVTVAYPYPNSPQHVGHGRTYTLADAHARFLRLKGYNVLFPMGFHYTGTPILGMARRVESGDKEIIDNLRNLYGVPEEEIDGFVDPIKIARYFHHEIKAGMIEMGYSIDWRREFTTVDPAYSKFVEWQINTLREKGLITRGSHPVGWCPKDQNPISQHDTLGDVEPAFTEYVMIKFLIDGYVVPVATLRPETIFGVTNLWINPDIQYEKVSVNGQDWIVSKECAYKLEFLDRNITYKGSISGAEMVGKTAVAPHTGAEIPVLPARFVQAATGTGIVMSVPAHAPYDWQALRDLAVQIESPVSDTARDVQPISIIEISEYGDFPASDAISKIPDCTGQTDPRLEDATKEVYSKEFYEGHMKSSTGRFAGLAVRQAKEDVGEWLFEHGHAETLLEITDAPVRCRCGAECVVKVLNDQWFLNYNDSAWKDTAHECLKNMSIKPQEIRQEFDHVIDWLHERACARRHGLGTRLPWDQDWIVESLSDSVIYMAYYTISRFVNDGTLKPEHMTKEFFDCILLGRWDDDNIKEWRRSAAGISEDVLRSVREEFRYFYPVDHRHSGRDLVPNHLTFFVLNHIAIFDKHDWPQGIVVNGSILMDGSKMSKSMGNIIPLRQAIREHGADPIRLAIITSAELLQDADFNIKSVHSMRTKLESLHTECLRLRPGKETSVHATSKAAEDQWLVSRTQQITADVEEAMENMRMREALHLILFEMESALAWHSKRVAAKGRDRTETLGVLHRIATARVIMLQPFAPHITEKMWTALGYEIDSWSRIRWPSVRNASGDSNSTDDNDGDYSQGHYDSNVTDAVALQAEDLLKATIDDIASIIKVTKIKPARIVVYVAGDPKRTIYNSILDSMQTGETSMKQVMRRLLADHSTSSAKKMPDFVQKAIKDILSDPVRTREMRMCAPKFNEVEFLVSELPALASAEFGATDISVFVESDPDAYDPKNKAAHARPFKPAILIED